MVNTNIQGAIPLVGPGLVVRKKGNFHSGEYKRLANVEIADDGSLKNRRQIQSTGMDGASWGMTNPQSLIGYINEFTILVSKTEQRAVQAGTDRVLWSPTSLPVPAGGYHKIVGCFEYNKRWYWITMEYAPAVGLGEYKVCLYWTTNIPGFASPIESVVFADLTRTVLFTQQLVPPLVNNFFIHKERLWITCEDRVYFSKATDPTVFAVPDGGFVGIADRSIKYAFSLSDTIYILCSDSIFNYTYSVDPNDDGYLRQFADAIGGDWGCVHQNTPYIINNGGVYALTGLSVEKIIDTDLDYGIIDGQFKLVSFDKYLVIVMRNHVTYSNAAQFSAEYWDQTGKVFTPFRSYNVLGYNVFFLNTETKSMSALDFTDSNDTTDKGYVVDVFFNPTKDFWGEQRFYLLTNKIISQVAGVTTTKGSTYFMNAVDEGYFVYDKIRRSDNVVKTYKPRYMVEIEGFAPDGNEYMMKKFRNLLLMGKFPKSKCGIQIGYDNQPYGDFIELANENFDNMSPHFPSRVPINQRARSLNIKISTIDNYAELAEVYDQFEISDIRTLWTYTGRAPENMTQTLANQTP